ncbi:hypothetical protein [uncultured Adlercreutzia sp.]|uniref:hypothetical protein n=1 Tax=uncultured Adlercreutzia sp. TaxID=875803 RepID=UPI0026F39AE1|nr:hypothetical protein [uncultured Adlercreutzia sp.]
MTPYTHAIIGRYLFRYPRDYSKEEVDILLNQQIEAAAECSGRAKINAIELVIHAAKELLVYQGGDRIAVRPGSLMEWNGIANRIDQNVLFAAHDEYYGIEQHPAYTFARYDDRRLDRILSKGVAENHAHLKGSGYSAEINWYHLFHLQAYRPAVLKHALNGLLSTKWLHPDADEAAISLALLKVPVLRSLLYAYTAPEGDAGSASCSGTTAGAVNSDVISELIARLLFVRDEISLDLLLRDKTLEALMSVTADQVRDAVLGSPSAYHAFEQQFLRTVLNVLRCQPLDAVPPLVLYGFNVYICALTQFKLWLTHDNLLMGFSRFSEVESRKECLIDCVPGAQQMLYRSVFDRYYRTECVRYVELRTTPKELRDFVKLVDDLKRANDEACRELRGEVDHSDRIEFRIAFHFIKDGRPVSSKDYEARRHTMIEASEKGMRCLAKIFEMGDAVEGYADRVSAIDTANFELNTRPEVYGPVFRGFKRLAGGSFRLGLTYHVGEDFPTLCNGLRAIDEAIVFLGLSGGDRLGHATALGLDVEDYFSCKRGYITSTLQDYVDDIAWLWGILVDRMTASSDILAFLEREFNEYASLLFSKAGVLRGFSENGIAHGAVTVPNISEYLLSYELRGNDPYLYLDPCSSGSDRTAFRKRMDSERARRAEESLPARELYARYHFDGAFKKAGLENLVVPVREEYVSAVKMAQKGLCEKIHEREISIETNPTSNRKISSVRHYIDLPLIRLNRHGLSDVAGVPEKIGPDIPLTVNSDDSGVFQTDLAMEYALLVEALKRAGFAHEEIYDYIDYLRELSICQSAQSREQGAAL